jgi:hypothetical protein
MEIYQTAEIGNYLQDFEKRFKLTLPETLFGLDWKNLTKTCCPVCGCKLRYSMNKDLFICRSLTHRRKFVIKRLELERIVSQLQSRVAQTCQPPKSSVPAAAAMPPSTRM